MALEPIPFIEAILFSLSRKVILPGDYYGKLAGLYRTLAFSASGIASLRQLQFIKDTLDKSLANGTSFKQWQADVKSGVVPVGLPDNRLDTIYRNGIQTAYSRGRCERHSKNLDVRPWLMYDAVNDTRTRPEHRAWDGFVARYDDPFWSAWTPPNGHRCRCTTTSLSDAQAFEFLDVDQKRLVDNPELSINRQKAQPDPGWDYNPCAEPTKGMTQTIDKMRLNADSIATAARLDALKPGEVLTVEQMLAKGGPLLSALLQGDPTPELFRERLALLMGQSGVTVGAVPTVGTSKNGGKELLLDAAAKYPALWVAASNRMGKTHTVGSLEHRGFYTTVNQSNEGIILSKSDDLGQIFGRKKLIAGEGYLVADSVDTAVHEYAHRLQSAMPELDNYFQSLHIRRTQGEELKKLSELTGAGYADTELAKRDRYINPYFGKEYPAGKGYTGAVGALEVMPMTYQALFTNSVMLDGMIATDSELLALAISLLINYRPYQ